MKGGDKIIQKLKDYFANRDDVAMAFLFGSHAKTQSHSGSDWDIAVYFKPSMGIEYEEQEREYPSENEVLGNVMDILETDNIDLLVLNRAPATIVDSAMRGIPLIIKDRGLWLEFMLIITKIAEDFREFARDYHEIYLRSASLNIQDADRLQRTIEFIEQQMTLYAVFSGWSFAEYEKDLVKRGGVERWIENMLNSVADISKIIISSSKKPSPYGYADTVRTALVYLDLPEDFWNKFLGWVKLRNILAHEYLDIKWNKVSDFIKNSEPYFQLFAAAAAKFLAENAKNK